MSDRILVLGAQGMLGRALMAEAERRGIEATGLGRQQVDVTDPTAVFIALYHADPAVVINAAGIIPERNTDPTFAEMIRVNAIAPRLIAEECRKRGVPLIHVSTDCVFDDSEYGRSKALGEVFGEHFLTVRTSFVGPGHGLWEYIASQPHGATIMGYDRAMWSGSTVRAVAAALLDMAQGWPLGGGLITLATEYAISKHTLSRALIEHLGRNDLHLRRGGPAIDRSLKPSCGFVLPYIYDALKAEHA